MSGTLSTRVYTPPAPGSFDPYTVGITGRIPSFYSYQEPPPRVLTPAPAPEVASSGGGGDGGSAGDVESIGSTPSGGITGLGPNPGSLDRGFGQAAYGQLGQAVGSLAGLATGVPGLGLGLGALGTLADTIGLNQELGMMGLPQDVSFASALANNLSFGLAGTPAATQFGNVMGFEALAEAPLSAFSARGTPSVPGFGTPAVGAAPSDFGGFSNAAAQAAAQAVSDAIAAGFGPESAGYGGGFAGSMADAVAAAEAANVDADAGPGGVSSGGEGGSPGSGGDASQGGSAGEASSDGAGGMGWKKGGLVKFAQGGVVQLEGGGKVAIGPGGGLDDLIPTSINGRRAAALSDGEFVIPADVVSMMGDGSSNAGARRLYDLVKQIRQEKTGTTRQAGPLPTGEILKRTLGE